MAERHERNKQKGFYYILLKYIRIPPYGCGGINREENNNILYVFVKFGIVMMFSRLPNN